MYVEIIMTGVSALAMHNADLVNKDHPITQAIAKITDKGSRNQTEDDRREVQRLEFLGGLYCRDDIGPYVPASNIRQTFIEASKVRRLGTTMARALVPGAMDFPLDYGRGEPRDPMALWADPKYRWLTPVGVGTKRVMRMRPQFPRWSLTSTWYLNTEVMDFDDFKDMVTLAGKVQGLGDGRILGYGRFTATVTEMGDLS